LVCLLSIYGSSIEKRKKKKEEKGNAPTYHPPSILPSLSSEENGEEDQAKSNQIGNQPRPTPNQATTAAAHSVAGSGKFQIFGILVFAIIGIFTWQNIKNIQKINFSHVPMH
jgi:hypothetical protein